ncbi:glutamate decarboxylase ['Osedax' symbiont bacterium Rs2_46_30_T18]|nr:glutamate decarboxylase ['Osedax' symbiont bacterium Rs2_46_30_T18]
MSKPFSVKQSLAMLQQVIEQLPAKRKVAPAPSAPELQETLDISLNNQGVDTEQLVCAAKAYLEYNPDVSQVAFYKLLYSGLNTPALLGDWVTSLSNATMHTYQVSPVATLMELELIKQWNNLVGFTQGDGVMVSGGSQANLIAMLLARHKRCPDIKTKGLQGQTLVAFVSDQAHYSSLKAANVLGIGSDNLIAVSSDDQGRLDPQALEFAIQSALAKGHTPFFVGLTAGTTVIGAYDPIQPSSLIAKKYDLWLHVDGAWGAPVLFSSEHRHLLADSELADSVTWDAHKLMNVPVTAAVILVKQSGLLRQACSGGGGDYLFHSDENEAYNLGERSIQCGRRADALKVWMSWKAIGSQGFSDKIDHLFDCKTHCVEQIESISELQMLAPAAYLNVLFRYQPSEELDEQQLRQLNIAICKKLKAQGTYIDYATYKGRSGIRLILANSDCQRSDIDDMLLACISAGDEIYKGK